MIPVKFNNQQGQKLFGIVHHPEKEKRTDAAIIILSPGIKSRVAPHRMYIKMARRFVELGFSVLRFDFYGLGDSEGEIEEEFVADLYGSIQVGRYANDTYAAMDWMQREYKIEKFIFAGLCGGAITGLFAGANDTRVSGLIGLGIPVILDTSNVSQFNFITEGQLSQLRKGYLSKILDPESWRRFFSMQSDYKMILKSLVQPMKKKISGGIQKEKSAQSVENEDGNKDNFNYLFPAALDNFAANRKVLLLFSETDRLYWEFEEKYLSRYKGQFEKISANIDVSITKDANHIYSFKEWQQDMLDKSCTWLEKQFRTIQIVG